uniref:DNA-directed RNA polymerase subunit alpha n=1 Tax=candidate division CPR3 bacterium TaxID=2268181 RepID=A0A7C4QXQ4_UNCC3
MQIEEIILPEIKTIKEEGNIGVYSIEPLHPGYGMTVGNSLRRVMLSSLPGAAITSIKIKGVSHEFSTIPGVKEDTLSIILNIKQIRLKIHQGDKHTLKLSVKGAKEVKAGDIKTDADVEIINKDLVLFTTNEAKSEVEIEFEAEIGRGYLSAEERKEKRPLGEITIDSLFAPIEKVSYLVENTRVGQATNFDKINIQITTDGSITPKQAMIDAASILVEQFSLLAGEREPTKIKEKKSAIGSKKDEKMEDTSVEEVDFSTRTINALLKNNIKTMGELAKLNKEDIGSLRGMGAKAQEEIEEKMTELGLL